MRSQYAKCIRDESTPYQALADAIILMAIEDYRQAARAVRKLQQQMYREDIVSETVQLSLQQRVACWQGRQKEIEQFMRSRYFSLLCDMDGSEVFCRLEKENV